MTVNKKTIIFTFVISIMSLVICCLITINIKIKFLEFNYLSNEFFFSIFVGIFASTIVILICEIQKYLLNKKTNEDFIYSYMVGIFSQLLLIKKNVSMILENKKEIISNILFDEPANIISINIQQLYNVDYVTFYKKNKFSIALDSYKKYIDKEIYSLLGEFGYFKVAYNEEKIKIFLNQKNEVITCENDIILSILKILNHKVNKSIDFTKKYLEQIDYKGKYEFRTKFSKIETSYYKIGQLKSTKEFIEENLNCINKYE